MLRGNERSVVDVLSRRVKTPTYLSKIFPVAVKVTQKNLSI